MKIKSPLAAWRAAQEPKLSMQAFGALFDPPVHKATVLRWELSGIPAARLVEVAAVTGMEVPVLRPDLFPSRPAADAAASTPPLAGATGSGQPGGGFAVPSAAAGHPVSIQQKQWEQDQ